MFAADLKQVSTTAAAGCLVLPFAASLCLVIECFLSNVAHSPFKLSFRVLTVGCPAACMTRTKRLARHCCVKKKSSRPHMLRRNTVSTTAGTQLQGLVAMAQ